MTDVLSPSRRRHTLSSSTASVEARNVGRVEPHPGYHPPPSHSRTEPWLAESPSRSLGASGSNTRITPMNLMSTMRRSLSSATRKRDRSPLDSGMYSTPEERSPPVRSRYNVHDAPRPTIQQIAMGLHTSRTPHLRQPHNSNPPSPHPSTPHSAYPGENDSRRESRFLKPLSANSHRRSASTSSTIPLPPPPARSALKKPGTPTTSPGVSAAPLTPSVSDLSLSESTLTSNAPSTPRSNRGVMLLPTRLQFSVSKLLRVPSRKGSGASSAHSDDDSVSTELTPRKIVRFSTSPTVSEPAIATATLS